MVFKCIFVLVRSQLMFVTTTTAHRHLYDHVSTGFIHEELRLKCQLDLAARKSDEHIKSPNWFADTKVYSLLQERKKK